MSKNIPEYLRLHTEDGDATTPACPVVDVRTALPTALTQVMGWHVSWTASSDPPGQFGSRLELGNRVEAGTNCPRGPADQLITLLNELLGQTTTAWAALAKREAELAAGVPVTRRADEGAHLAQRLEAILRGGAEAVGCHAAGLYLLDESTSELKLRSAWGLPKGRLAEPPRALRGAVADLEALMGNAVVLEDARLLSHWKPPEEHAASVCVPVSTPTTPLGTMWVFSNAKRDFRDHETQLLEIVAGRLAAELEREMLLNEAIRAKQWNQQISRVSSRQQDRLPSFPPQLDHWDFGAWSLPAGELAAEFHDWGVTTDGRPYLVIGRAEGQPLEGALNSAALHAAMKAHLQYCREPRALFEALNETIWCGSAGDLCHSLFFALLEPETGAFEYGFVGRTTAHIVNPRGVRPLVAGTIPLGVDPGTRFATQHAVLQADEVLVLGGASISSGCRGENGGPSLEAFWNDLRHGMADASSATALIDRSRKWLLANRNASELPECTLVMARRLPR